MKIGIDVRPMVDRPAGIGYYVRELIIAFTQLHPSDRFVLYSQKDFTLDLNDLNAEKRVITYPSFLWHLAAYLDAKFKSKIDVYFSTHSSIICLIPGLKTVLEVYDLSSIVFPSTHGFKERFLLSKSLLGWALKKVDKIIVPSDFTKQEILQIFKINSEKIIKIYAGVVKTELARKRESPFLFPYFLFIGTIEPRKNLQRLIQAFSRFKHKKKTDHKLVIAGKTGWLTQEIFEETKKLHIEEDVVFTGYLESELLNQTLAHTEALVFPSLYEGFGLPPLQAADLGVLIISSNTASMPEILGNGAIYVDPLSVESICDGLKKAVELNNKEKKVIIETARENLNRFNWQTTARQTLCVISEVK